jgi:hypothetical protein
MATGERRRKVRQGLRRSPSAISVAFAASACVATGVLFDGAPAEACSYPTPPPKLTGYPPDGAVGVPIDVRPIYDHQALSQVLIPRDLSVYVPPEELAPAFELVDDAGAVTPLRFGVGGGAWFIELVPPTFLAPRTHYTVRTIAEMTVAGEVLQASFTTGDGAFGEAPGPFDAAIQHYTLKSDTPTSCSPWPHGTCIYFPEPSLESGVFVQGIHLWEGRMDSNAYLSRTPWFVDLAGIDQGTPFDCIQLRRRAPNGALGEATVRCRQDGELYDVRGSERIACGAAGITQDDRLVSSLPERDEPAAPVAPEQTPEEGDFVADMTVPRDGSEPQDVAAPGEGAARSSAGCSIARVEPVSGAPYLLLALLGLLPLRASKGLGGSSRSRPARSGADRGKTS